MSFSFHPEARAEFLESINYFEEAEEGLGLEYSLEVFSTIQRIVDRPLAWPVHSARTRRCLCRRFRYGVVYRVLKDEIVIFAVMQLNRKPGYWAGRLR